MLTRRQILGALGASAGAGALGIGAAQCASARMTSGLSTISSASAFVDSVGVNAHWTYLDTPYGTDYERVRGLLVASGVKHVRGETVRAADLWTRGIASTVLIDSDMEGVGDPVSQIDALAPLARTGAVTSVEGTNESDVFWVDGRRSYRGQGFPRGPVLWQEDLYRRVNASADTRDLTVIGMSFGKTYWGGGHPFGPGELRGSTDWGNFHPYPSGNPYTDQYRYAGIEQYYADSDFPTVALDVHPLNLEVYGPPFGDLPMAITETGYSTWKWGQSEKTQGKYLPRLFLENFRLGIPRTFTYEFVDAFADRAGTRRDAHFGWLRHDLTPKPAYTAMKSLMSVVADDGPVWGPVPAAVDAEITVTPPAGYDPAQLHHVALRKADGTVVVALWHEVSSNDISGLDHTPMTPIREISTPAFTVAVDAGRDLPLGRASARHIDDLGRLQPKALARGGTAITAVVGDRVTLLTIPAS